MKVLAIAGTFDTKGEEYQYVKSLATNLGLKTLMIHTGVFEPSFEPDVSNAEVARAAGADIGEIAARKDRAYATEILAQGMKVLIPRLYQEGKFHGILSCGGSGGTALVTPAMQELPVGVPKLMISTMASGNTEQYVGTSDIILIPSIVDVSGLNLISRTIYKNAVCAAAGMLNLQEELKEEETETRPLVAATMFGVTTPCVTMAKDYLEQRGYEVLVFHATGVGGRTMEHLIDAGFFEGVLDLTTTEWCDQVVGGVLAAGSHRCEAAARNRIPQVVSVGALDMVNFGPYDTVPEKFADRNLYKHNPTVTLMRTTAEENKTIAGCLVEKWNEAMGGTVLMLPLKGISMIDAEEQAFWGAEEDEVLFDTLREGLNQDAVKIVEMDAHINDREFAEAAAECLIGLMKEDIR